MKVTGKRVLLVIAAAAVLGVGGLILHTRSAGYRVESILRQIREPAGDREIGRIRLWLIDLHMASEPRSLTHDEAVWDLVQIGPSAVPLLIAALEDPEISVRLVAIEALGWLRDRRAVDPLMAVLDVHVPEGAFDRWLDEAPLHLQAAAATALGRIGDAHAAPKLAKLLTEASLLTWASSDGTLAFSQLDIGRDVLVDPRKSGDGGIVPDSMPMSSQGGLFALRDSKEQMVLDAGVALVRIGAPGVPHVAPLLRHGDHRARGNAACVLGAIGGVEAARVLVVGGKGDDLANYVCHRALEHIGCAATGPLVEALRDRTRPVNARVDVVLILGRIKDPAAVDGLMETALSDENEDLSGMAQCALAGMVPEVLDPLEKHWLASSDPKARALAASVLGQSGHASAVAPLAGLLGDPDPAVRAEVVRSLSQLPSWREANLRTGASGEALNAFPAVLPAVAEHLPAIRALLADEHAEVRRSAARAAGLLDDKKAVEALIGLLRDADPTVMGMAVTSLQKIGDERGIQAVRACTGQTQPAAESGGP